MKLFNQTKKYKRGYLLVEMMVSLTIFSIVVTASTGAVLAIITANSKSQTTKSVMDNLSVAVENMSRSIRIGTQYHCFSDVNTQVSDDTQCKAGAMGISFIPQDSIGPTDIVKYYFDSSQNLIMRSRGGATAVPLTAPEVKIFAMKFYIYGLKDTSQMPRVFILINGISGPANNSQQQSNFTMQTSVTQRGSTIAPAAGATPTNILKTTTTFGVGSYSLVLRNFAGSCTSALNVDQFDGTNFSGSGSVTASAGCTPQSWTMAGSVQGTGSGSTMSFDIYNYPAPTSNAMYTTSGNYVNGSPFQYTGNASNNNHYDPYPGFIWTMTPQ
jgi:type II secretory pathway pseudopilin PulG